MNTTDKDKAAEPGDIEALLPWHAAGTLSRGDARRVEEALARDPELARRYDLVREEFGETIHLNETLGAPSAKAMAKLFTKIDAEPKRRQAMSPGLSARVAEFFASLSPRTLAWSAAGAALVLMLQAAVITGVMMKGTAPAGYQTASTPSIAQDAGAFALIRFAPQATSGDINKFLETNKLSIVAGPMSGGLYKVRVAAAGLPKAELGLVVKRLQDDRTVSFIATTE
jgi:anti-sigma-K factor RskA